MAVLTINNANMPSPSKLIVTLTDIGSPPERNLAGDMVRDSLGVKRTLALSWSKLTSNELTELLSAVSGIFFFATYCDPVLGCDASREFFCLERSMGVFKMENGVPVWTDVNMKWTER